ncbi:ABC transporter substrate-binding protein [Corynebacterium breve]|uniref:ABC transporter substrate-binding protein n=1 Tax=Corynebacterium breve TaxID=3049799 RepID=A0ABY8VFD2_9CORY|nr:ABC transporter substrate-binding protein [Corynebacterium breve]WIM68340.1 ABC transporter substrate-binding protein [Corynebacterium breve]
MVARLSTPKALVAIVASASLLLVSCSEGAAPTDNASSSSDSVNTIEVEDNNGTQTVPSPPTSAASLDNRTFEVLEQWGVDLVAAPIDLMPNTIGYSENSEILNIGNHREPDLELLTAAEPDLIINGQRFTSHAEAIAKLNPDTPIVDFEPRDGEPFDEELIRQVEELGKIFGKEAEADSLVQDFTDAVERAKAAYDPEKKVMAINVSGGNIGYVAPTVGRTYGPIFDLIGLTPALEVPEGSSNHEGDDISVEAIAQSNPDWLLVLDRDAGTSTAEGSKPAKAVVEESQALQNVTAINEGHVVYAPNDTYTNESIITYTEILNDIADAFEAAK